MEILSKRIIKKNQVEISAWKHTITKLKKKKPTMDRLNSRMERIGSRISELEDRTIKITLSEKEKETSKMNKVSEIC